MIVRSSSMQSIQQTQSQQEQYMSNSTFDNNWNEKTKDLSNLYFDLAQVPSVSSASYLSSQSSVSVVFSERDIENNNTTSFIKFYHEEQGGKSFKSVGFPAALTNVELHSFSPSGRYLCLFKKSSNNDSSGKTGSFVNYQIEIWDQSKRIVVIPVSDVHGRIYTDIYFSRICWTRDESCFYYVAEYAEKPKSYQKVFWDKDFRHEDKDEDKETNSYKIPGKYNFESQEEWGELLVGAKTARIYKCSWTRERNKRMPVLLKGIDSSIAVNSPQLTPDENGMIFVGYNVQRRRLGLVYCYQRQNDLYHLTFAEKEEEKCKVEKITPNDEWNVLRPVFSPDGSTLIYFTTGKVPYHNTCKRLMAMNWSTKETRVVVDYVEDVKSPNDFPGLYSIDLPQYCWTKDSRYCYINSCRRSVDAIYRIEPASGKVERVKNENQEQSMFFIATTSDGRILAYESSPSLPYRLLIGTPDQSLDGMLSMKWTEIDNCFNNMPEYLAEKIKSISWQIINVPTIDKTTSFECIVLEPVRKDKSEPVPLIMTPHGGPHSSYTTMYMMNYAYYALIGYAICEVNYRGSVGFGLKLLRSLVGKCGSQDVSDVYAATQYMISNEKFEIDKDRIAIIGGSHGGFLTGHMIGQYPILFRAAILLNPVTNIASMVSLSDIPDWCYTEANGIDYEEQEEQTFEHLSESERENLLLQQYKASPQSHAHKVDLDRCAVLILLGEEDRRVPPMNGREFYYTLKKKCKDQSRLQLHMYPKNSHPISSAECEADRTILSALWICRFV
jgi:acylaminoacyl-peptidase